MRPDEELAVVWIWGISLLLVVVVIVPVILVLATRLVVAAWRIEHYFRRTLRAAGGIAQNTANISALNDTIAVATTILGVAESIDQNCGAIHELLLSRAAADAPGR